MYTLHYHCYMLPSVTAVQTIVLHCKSVGIVSFVSLVLTFYITVGLRPENLQSDDDEGDDGGSEKY